MMCEQQACCSLGTLLGTPQGWALALLHSPVAHMTAFTQSPPCIWDRKLLTESCPSTLTELPQRVDAFNPILQIRKLGPKRWRQSPRVTLGPGMSRWPLTHAGARFPPLQHSPGRKERGVLMSTFSQPRPQTPGLSSPLLEALLAFNPQVPLTRQVISVESSPSAGPAGGLPLSPNE